MRKIFRTGQRFSTAERLEVAARRFFGDDWEVTETLTKREARYLADQTGLTTGVVWKWFSGEGGPAIFG